MKLSSLNSNLIQLMLYIQSHKCKINMILLRKLKSQFHNQRQKHITHQIKTINTLYSVNLMYLRLIYTL